MSSSKDAQEFLKNAHIRHDGQSSIGAVCIRCIQELLEQDISQEVGIKVLIELKDAALANSGLASVAFTECAGFRNQLLSNGLAWADNDAAIAGKQKNSLSYAVNGINSLALLVLVTFDRSEAIIQEAFKLCLAQVFLRLRTITVHFTTLNCSIDQARP